MYESFSKLSQQSHNMALGSRIFTRAVSPLSYIPLRSYKLHFNQHPISSPSCLSNNGIRRRRSIPDGEADDHCFIMVLEYPASSILVSVDKCSVMHSYSWVEDCCSEVRRGGEGKTGGGRVGGEKSWMQGFGGAAAEAAAGICSDAGKGWRGGCHVRSMSGPCRQQEKGEGKEERKGRKGRRRRIMSGPCPKQAR
jgi:hypothetical protein